MKRFKKKPSQSTLIRILTQMAKTLDELLAEVKTIHSTNGIPQEINDSVTAAVNNVVPGLVTTAVNNSTAALQSQLADTNTLVTTLIDQLANGDVGGAATTAQSIATATAPAVDTGEAAGTAAS